MCLVGPPGIGKTAIAEVAAEILGKRFVRICCSKNLSVEDLFGTYLPLDKKSNDMIFNFCPGVLTTAIH